jgi:S-adenosylmethionine synthetase
MKKEFLEYLKEMGFTESIFERVEAIIACFEQICCDEIKDIHVSDFVTGDGSREYDSLWLFSDRCAMEAKQFLTTENFDITPIKKAIRRWGFKKKDYDFSKATESSRIHLIFHSYSMDVHGAIKASKKNCDHLKYIALKYFKPNLMECGDT